MPVASILFAAVVGILAFGPFKSWNALVSVVTAATAIMYGFAPVALASLHKVDSGRPRSYRVPMPGLLLPAAFCCANLIMYWGGFDTNWKLAAAMVVGLVMFAIGAVRGNTGAQRSLKNATWMFPWLGGQVLLGWIGRYGGGRNLLPNWIDIVVVLAFSLVIFYWAVAQSLTAEKAALEVAKDAHQLTTI